MSEIAEETEYVVPRVTRAMFDAMTPAEQAQVLAPSGEMTLTAVVIDGPTMRPDQVAAYQEKKRAAKAAGLAAMIETSRSEEAIRAEAIRAAAQSEDD